MKTALQEAFSKLEELHPSLFDIHTEKGRMFVHTFHEYLELEKEQIINAIYNGWNEGCRFLSNEKLQFESPEQYYNETFKQQ